MEKRLNFQLHAKQLEVFNSAARFRVVCAGRRFGKTWLAVSELAIAAITNPRTLYWYVAPSYRQAKMIAWRMFRRFIPKEFEPKFNESELAVTLNNGSSIELRGADNEDSLRGTGLHGLVIDEFATIYDNWTVWFEVLRPALTDKKGWCLFIGTPRGKDAFWELWTKGQRKEDNFESWQFKTADNLALPEIKDEVEEARKSTPERHFKQEYEASFDDYHGLVYPEFKHRIHLIDRYDPPAHYRKVGAIDVAVSGTTAVLKCFIDDDDRIIVYDEFYRKDQRVSDVAREIQEDKVYWLIDPHSRNQSQRNKEGHLYSLYNEYADNGIYATCGEDDHEAGINRTGEMLKTERIKIMKNCKNLVWELERYHYVEPRETRKGDVRPEVFKRDDHLCDCLRYIVMSRSKKRYPDKGAKRYSKYSIAKELDDLQDKTEDWRAKYNKKVEV